MSEDTVSIATRACPRCSLCGCEGDVLYRDLQDRLFGAPGSWSMRRCPQADCGLLWLDPMPLEEEIGKAYRDYYTHPGSQSKTKKRGQRRGLRLVARDLHLHRKFGYEREFPSRPIDLLSRLILLDPCRRLNFDFHVMSLPRRAGGRLLEIGSGDGTKLLAMQELGWKAEGIDFDPDAVRSAREKGLRVDLGQLADRKYPPESFDAIMMSHLIEHVYDPAELIRECHRILKPGGVISLVTPNAGSWGHRMFAGDWRGLEPPRHLHLFTLPGLRRIVVEAGFDPMVQAATVRGAKSILSTSRAIRRCRQLGGSLQVRSGERRWARVMQYIEWIVSKARPNIGEEIVITARRS